MGYRLALENCRDDKGSSAENVESDRRPKETPDQRLGEDPQEEEEQRKLQLRNLEEVEDLEGIQPTDKAGDVVEGHRPNVPSKSVWNYTSVDDYNGRYARDQCR